MLKKEWQNDFSTKLKKAREKAGFSQNELARMASLDPGHVNKLEKGKAFPSEATAKRLAIILNAPDLLPPSNEPEKDIEMINQDQYYLGLDILRLNKNNDVCPKENVMKFLCNTANKWRDRIKDKNMNIDVLPQLINNTEELVGKIINDETKTTITAKEKAYISVLIELYKNYIKLIDNEIKHNKYWTGRHHGLDYGLTILSNCFKERPEKIIADIFELPEKESMLIVDLIKALKAN